MVDRTGQWSVSADGYLSSWVAVETGVGLVSCPWIVDVPPGRQVNITDSLTDSVTHLYALPGHNLLASKS